MKPLRRPLGIMLLAIAILAPTSAAAVATSTQSAFAAAQPAAGTVTVTPSDGLEGGQTVTVTWSGFPADKENVVMQCNTEDVTAVGQCHIPSAMTAASDASGGGTLQFTVDTGMIGDGTCDDSANNNCTVFVSDQPTQTTVGFAPIRFGAAAPTSAGSSADPASGPAELPRTGPGSAVGLVAVGAAALSFGALSVLVARARVRRRASAG